MPGSWKQKWHICGLHTHASYLGHHQPEVYFCLFKKLFLIFTSKYQSLGVILLFMSARTQSPRQIQVHKQSSHQHKIHTVFSLWFHIAVMEKRTEGSETLFYTDLSWIICLWYRVMPETVKAAKAACALWKKRRQTLTHGWCFDLLSRLKYNCQVTCLC